MSHAVRLAYVNRVASAASMVASAQQTGLPASNLVDQLRSLEWRSPLGYNVVAGWNDRLDFADNGNAKAADLTPGNYASPFLYLAHVAARMNAQSGLANTYTAVRDNGTGKVTLARATGSATFSLLWQSGANAARSAGKDLGFDVSANDTGAALYEADLASYHSREWILIDLGSALGVKFAGFLDHNVITGGTVTLQGNASDSWATPAFSQVLSSAGPGLRAAWLAALQTYRYWRILVEDVQNPLGYSAAGVVWLGEYFEPSRPFDITLGLDPEALTSIRRATQGAHRLALRPRRRRWNWKWSHMPAADWQALELLGQTADVGVCLFLGLDVVEDPQSTYYGFFSKPMGAGDHTRVGTTEPDRYQIPATFEEALG